MHALECFSKPFLLFCSLLIIIKISFLFFSEVSILYFFPTLVWTIVLVSKSIF